jgi:hypothetical protein
VWRALPWLSLYGKYSENFGATPGLYVGADGPSAIFLPQQSASEWEGGLKVALADDRIAGTVAFFSLIKENIASPLLEPALDPSGLLFLTGRRVIGDWRSTYMARCCRDCNWRPALWGAAQRRQCMGFLPAFR